MRSLGYALAFTFLCCPLAAQPALDVPVHTRVRVSLPDTAGQPRLAPRQQWLRGEVAALGTDTLYLSMQGTAGPIAIPRRAIRRIDRSLGVPSRPASAIQGAVGFAIIGALYGIVLKAVEAEGWEDQSTGESAAIGAGTGAVAGLVVGALFPTERWRRVRMR